MKKKPLMSCIMLVDEFPWNHHVPWKEAIASSLYMCDETIVMLGDKPHSSDDISVRDYLRSIKNSSGLTIIEFPWPETWNWMFIAQALNVGLLHAQGDFVCRLLMDEYFPPEQKDLIHQELAKTNKNMLWLGRNYVLGLDKLCYTIDKPFFFRRKKPHAYGRVPAHDKDPTMFDNPVSLGWFERYKFWSTKPEKYLSRYPLPPLGTRKPLEKNIAIKNSVTLDAFILNTDVTFCTAQEILQQKFESKQGYDRLPPEYALPLLISPEEVVKNHIKKVTGLLHSQKTFTYMHMPEPLLQFMRKTHPEEAPIFKLLMQHVKEK